MKKILFILDKIKTNLLNLWDKYIAAYGKASKEGYKSNAFAPIAWFSIFLILPIVTTILVTKDNTIRYLMFGLLSLVILFTLTMYIVLLVKDPKLLQSEEYRLEEKKLEIIAEKGGEIRIEEAESITKGIIGESLSE